MLMGVWKGRPNEKVQSSRQTIRERRAQGDQASRGYERSGGSLVNGVTSGAVPVELRWTGEMLRFI